MTQKQYDPQAELNRLLEQNGKEASQGDVIVIGATTNVSMVQKRMRTAQEIPKELLDFILRSESNAAARSEDTKDPILVFDEVNASDVAIVDGFIIHPHFDDDGNVKHASFVESPIKIPFNTPLFPYVQRGDVKVCKLTGDAVTKAEAYKKAASRLFLDRGKYLMGNLKSEESVLAVVTREQANEMLGSDLGIYDNPFKPWLAAFGTPSRLVFREGPEYIRVRLIDDLKTKYGHKYHDGTLICRYDVMYHKYISQPKGMTDEDYAVYKAEHDKTQIIKSSHQVRWHGYYTDKEGGEELFLDAVKCKPYKDRVKYFELCQEFDFDPFEADAIMSLGNIKTKTHDYEHGEILMVPTELYRVIGLSSKSGKSSIGAQAMCLDLDTVKKLFSEAGMAERARIFKAAADGDAKALEDIIVGQEEHSTFEDVTIMWIINQLYAVPLPDGSWGWPRFESNFNNVCVRLNRFFIDNVIKCRLSPVALYLEVNPKLDDYEHQYLARTGSHINYVILPRKGKIRKMLVGGKDTPPQYQYLNIGRNPIVAQGNLQGVEVLRNENGTAILNDSHDTIEISAALAHEMFGDQDGDKVIFAPSNVAHFPVYRSKLPHEDPKVKSEPEDVSDRDLAINVINAAVFICEAAMDTGVLDFTRRQIYIEALHKKNPITPQEGYEIGQICENAIQRMKKRGGKTAKVEVGEDLSVKEMLIKKYARGGSILPARMAPKEFIITKRSADRRGRSERIVLLRKIEIINATKFAEWFPFNVAFDQIKGAKMDVLHGHSALIQKMFEGGWKIARGIIQQNKDTYGFTIEQVMKEGDNINSFYRERSRGALKMEDEARVEEFRKIKLAIRSYLESIKGNIGEYGDKFLLHLALYLGTRSFGLTSGYGTIRSKSGLALRVFPENILIDAARIVNPNNPWCKADGNKRAERMIAKLERKLKENKDGSEE